VRIFSRAALRDFWERHSDAEQPLRAWHAEVEHANWASTADIRARHRSAEFVANNRVIFNVGGNKYRLVIAVKYDFKCVYIRFVGTHAEYDDIDPATV
jgi:mRNA interferase HigB